MRDTATDINVTRVTFSRKEGDLAGPHERQDQNYRPPERTVKDKVGNKKFYISSPTTFTTLYITKLIAEIF